MFNINKNRERKEAAINDNSHRVSSKTVYNTVFVTIVLMIMCFIWLWDGVDFIYSRNGKWRFGPDLTDTTVLVIVLAAIYIAIPFLLDTKRLRPIYIWVEKMIIRWRELHK